MVPYKDYSNFDESMAIELQKIAGYHYDLLASHSCMEGDYYDEEKTDLLVNSSVKTQMLFRLLR